MPKKLIKRIISYPDGSEGTRGPNGYIQPAWPCSHCGRLVRYQKDDHPWHCSKDCAAGEAFKTRCDACHGAMRKPVVFGVEPKTGRKWVVCKSCALRFSYLFTKLSGVEPDFVRYGFEMALPLILSGGLKHNRLRIVGSTLMYLPKNLDPKTVDVEEDPTVRRRPGRTRKPKPLVLVETRLERVLRELKERGTLDQDGRFKENSPFAGKLYIDIYPDA